MWLGEDVSNLVHLIIGERASPAVTVNLGNLADEDSESSSDTLDNAKSESHLVLPIHVGVLHTKQLCEVVRFCKY